MKRLLAIATAAFIVSAAATRVHAEESWTPMLSKGTKELAVAGNVEFLEIDEINYNIDLSYGYFVRDGWELGARVGGSGIGGSHSYAIGVFTEYNFNRDKKWVPFVGAGVGVANVSYDDSLSTSTPLDDESGTFIDVEAGIKYFLRPYMAISTSFAFQVASKDIYATDESIEDNITKLKIGMRFYF